MSKEFEIGSTVVMMKSPRLEIHKLESRRNPAFEGVVTARGKDCIRVRYKGLFGITRNQWFSTVHFAFHFTKTEDL